MKRVAVSPEEVAKSLRAIVRDASDERFLAEYKDAHELAYPGPSGSRYEGGSRGAIAYSDPTLSAFDHRDKDAAGRPIKGMHLRPDLERWKSAARDAAHQINEAQKALGAAKHALEEAAGRRLFGKEPDPPKIDRKAMMSPDDFDKAKEAKARREAAGY